MSDDPNLDYMDNDSMRTNYSNLLSRVRELEAERDALRAEVDLLKNELVCSHIEVEKLRADNARLKKETTELHTVGWHDEFVLMRADNERLRRIEAAAKAWAEADSSLCHGLIYDRACSILHEAIDAAKERTVQVRYRDVGPLPPMDLEDEVELDAAKEQK